MCFFEHYLPGVAVSTNLHVHKPVIMYNLSQLSSDFIRRVQCDRTHMDHSLAGHAFAVGCYSVKSQKNFGELTVAGRQPLRPSKSTPSQQMEHFLVVGQLKQHKVSRERSHEPQQ
jgi:hypothetical protein